MEKRKLLKIAIIIPTYNEVSNIVFLLKRIFNQKELSSLFNINVLVVDDNSPDNTADKVRKYMRRNPKVNLLVKKEKEGLGAAYIEGIKYALKNLHPDVLVEMDGDGQHDPSDLIKLLSGIEDGYDFVIGSRYIDGGSIIGDWGIRRRFTSNSAVFMIRYGMGLKEISDVSGGYRAMRAEIFNEIDLDQLGVVGYAFQAALLEAVVHHKFKVTEVPITFDQRKEGESKMKLSDMLEGFALIYKTKLKRMMNNGP